MRTRADLKGITSAVVPLYASDKCQIMVQGTLNLSGWCILRGEVLRRTMVKDILAAIDAEIATFNRPRLY